jgi:hypothetical protein
LSLTTVKIILLDGSMLLNVFLIPSMPGVAAPICMRTRPIPVLLLELVASKNG